MSKRLCFAALIGIALAALSGCAVSVGYRYYTPGGYYGPDGYYYAPDVVVDHYYAPGWYHGRYWEGRRWRR